jgi:hypothetical protein
MSEPLADDTAPKHDASLIAILAILGVARPSSSTDQSASSFTSFELADIARA